MQRLLQPKFVLDSSVAMAWCFEDESTSYTEKLLAALMSSVAIVPAIWVLEVTNVLLMAEKRKRITSYQANAFKGTLQKFPIKICESNPSQTWDDIFKLTEETKLTAYDASYLYLAIQHNLPIATLDKELKKAAQTKGIVLYLH